MAQPVKHLPAMQDTWVWSLGWKDPPEKEMATHSSSLAWRIPWTEEHGGLQPMRLQESDTTEQLTHWRFLASMVLLKIMEVTAPTHQRNISGTLSSQQLCLSKHLTHNLTTSCPFWYTPAGPIHFPPCPGQPGERRPRQVASGREFLEDRTGVLILTLPRESPEALGKSHCVRVCNGDDRKEAKIHGTVKVKNLAPGGFPGGQGVKNPPCNAGNAGSIPVSGN